ncbi:MAG: hypothetical protein AAFX01_05310 [Cyanobacteria bacterium J06638_28]
MSNADYSPIRERLKTMQREQQSQPQDWEQLWDQARSPELPTVEPADHTLQRQNLAATVQALQARSQQTIAAMPKEAVEETSQAALPKEVHLHWQRLQQEANVINELAQRQALAIQNFKRSADRLGWSLRKQPAEYGLVLEQFCQLQEPAVAHVVQDDQQTLILTNQAVDLYQDERDASQAADEIRAFAQTQHHRLPRENRDVWGFLAEPLAILESVWQGFTSNLEGRSRLTPLDIVIWLGGGLIGRLALELAIAASPSLWPWLVGATIGAVALALYRFLMAPRPDAVFVTRLLLILIGLGIGGQL